MPAQSSALDTARRRKTLLSITTMAIVPFKTAQGQDELARRTRRLSQRHRTVLLLVDGRRSADEVLALALAAGADDTHYRDLLEMGLLALPGEATSAATVTAAPEVLPAADSHEGSPSVFHVELPIQADAVPTAAAAVGAAAMPPAIESAAVAVPAAGPAAPVSPPAAQAAAPAAAEGRAPDASNDSLLPSTQSLLPDSTLSDFGDLDGAGPPRVDGPLEEAREILMRAVRAEAPVAGQLTLMKIKRAADRAELESLLDEVEARIAKPRKMIVAAQTLRHVRHLLGMPTSTSFTML